MKPERWLRDAFDSVVTSLLERVDCAKDITRLCPRSMRHRNGLGSSD
jgi:hypothetical protein